MPWEVMQATVERLNYDYQPSEPRTPPAKRKRTIREKSQLYRHFDSDDNLLYVGISLWAVKRLIDHRESAHWFDSITKITIESFPSRNDAIVAEYEAIRREKPRHNIIGKDA